MLLLLLGVLAGSYFVFRPAATRNETIGGPKIAVAKTGPMVQTLRIGGAIQATEFTNITAPQQRAPESSGQLILLKLVPSGTAVKKGDLIAELDAQTMQDHVDDMTETVRQAEADVNTRKAEQRIDWENYQQTLRLAKSDWDKALQDARAESVKTDIERELLQLNVKQAEARYRQLQADIKNRQLSNEAEIAVLQLTVDRHRRHLERHRRDLTTYKIHAPADGLAITQSMFSSGEMRQIRQGDQVYAGLLFMKVVNPTRMQLEAKINQAESTLLRLHQPVTVRLDAFPGLTLPGHVLSVGALADATSSRFVRRISVVVRLDQMDSRVIPDLSAAGDVELARKQNALQIPRAAVRYGEGMQPYVTLRNGRQRKIRVGMETATDTEVLEGLKPGEEVRLD